MIAVSGSRPSTLAGRQAFQDIDQVAMARPVVKWAAEVPDAAHIPSYLERAYAAADSGRKGAVHLTMPVDLFAASAGGTGFPTWPALDRPKGLSYSDDIDGRAGCASARWEPSVPRCPTVWPCNWRIPGGPWPSSPATAPWGLERELQSSACGGVTVACELQSTPWDVIMEGFGGGGETVERIEQVRPAVERAFAFGVPYCLNVKIRGVRSPFTEWQIAGKKK